MSDKETVKIPKHVGIIMDGNRRWAGERNLSSFDGHKRGFEMAKIAPIWFFERGVQIVSLFAFSSDNWKRSNEEVNSIMKLLQSALCEDLDEFNSRGIKLLISGRIEELPGDLPHICVDAMAETKNNKNGTVNMCLNYGGQNEIIDSIKKMIINNVDISQVHEGMVRKYLYQSELPDPDIIIRTSGEKRLSGFLLWQSAYSELFFTDKYWPDFEQSDVEVILSEYSSRIRKYGGDT